MSGVQIWRCERCGRRSFPRRELCPYCGGRKQVAERAERGVAAQVTTHRGIAIACVRIEPDVAVLARVQGEVSPGSAVVLRAESGAIVGRP